MKKEYSQDSELTERHQEHLGRYKKEIERQREAQKEKGREGESVREVEWQIEYKDRGR